ncbi:MAG: hypothetical protein GTO12_26010 [Proteobacteria bacterium]|nr:hypothetical protein [Pseudomonadota bacterium]
MRSVLHEGPDPRRSAPEMTEQILDQKICLVTTCELKGRVKVSSEGSIMETLRPSLKIEYRVEIAVEETFDSRPGKDRDWT